jgi:LETM1 and EF-hand domain-containing protein 1, mitochondrial
MYKHISRLGASGALLVERRYLQARLQRQPSILLIQNAFEPIEPHLSRTHRARFHSHTSYLCKDPESKAEKTVNLLKEKIIQAPPAAPISAVPTAATETVKSIKKEEKTTAEDSQTKIDELASKEAKAAVAVETTQSSEKKENQVVSPQSAGDLKPVRMTLWQKIVAECKHYYHGFKLLYFETKVAYRLLKQVLQGHTLSRRERKQFTRTAADLFRLVPFSVFVIVPFLEFTLPIFLKLFPNMLPSTFQEESKEQEKLKKKLKAKLEIAKFLQDTLEETALQSKDADRADGADAETKSKELNFKFAEFMKKVRSKGEQPSNEEIMKYSSLFENELTLDNLNRQLLIALCQILDVSTLANIPPNHILRFQLRMRLRNLEADDRLILNEGVDSLTIDELQQACRERGMRSIGISEARLRSQLEQWLDLHINRKIPLSLLLLSRALYLPENLPPEDIIKSTISVLPKSIENATIAKIAEVSGEKVDNKIKLELLKQEEAEIKLEKSVEQAAPQPTPSPVPAAAPTPIESEQLGKEKVFEQATVDSKEKLVDKAQVLTSAATQELLSPKEIKEINQIIENLPSTEKKQVKAELDELKKDVSEYKEDIKEVEQLTAAESKVKLTETKSAKRLSKRVEKMISDLDGLLVKLEKESATPNVTADSSSSKNSVSIDELLSTIKKIRGVSNDVKEKRLVQVLQSLDMDKDGKIDDLNDVLKVKFT